MGVATAICPTGREATPDTLLITQVPGEPTREQEEVPSLAGKPDFEQIYKLHKGFVYSTCLRMLGNPDEAEDLTQDVFVHLFRKIDTFRGESAFRTWLCRLTINLVLMRLRRKDFRYEASLEELAEPEGEVNLPRCVFGAPDFALTGAIDRMSLQRAIVQLPFRCRMVFVLHDVQGYEHSEIAEILGLARGTSKSQLHKARVRLRKLLRGTGRRKVCERTVAPQVEEEWKASAGVEKLPSGEFSERVQGHVQVGQWILAPGSENPGGGLEAPR